MTDRVLKFSLASSKLCNKVFDFNIKVFNGSVTKATSEIAKNFTSKSKTRGKQKGFGFRHILHQGRLIRKEFTTDEVKFKTDGVNSKTSINKMKIRFGTRPQKYKKAPEPALIFYDKNRRFLPNDAEVEKAVVIDGCFDTNKVILERTAIPSVLKAESLELPNESNLKTLKKAIKATIRKLKIEQIGSPRFIDCLNCKFNKTTKAGFTSEHILGHKTKESSALDSVSAAERIWSNLNIKAFDVKKKLKNNPELDLLDELVTEFINNQVPGSGLYEIGARAKRDFTYEEDELASSRAVHMPEFHNEIVMAPWIDNITRLIKNSRKGPVYIGNSISDFVRYEKDIESHKSFLEGDWKRFDSTLYARICIIAIGILRLYYPKSDVRADAFFLFIVKNLIVKDYYKPGGKVIRMIHGLPSGTKSTNLLGSIINLLCLNFCIEKFNSKKFSFAVGGDDFVIFCKETLSVDQIEEIKLRSKELGMEFKFLDVKEKNSKNLDEMPYFYKYTVRCGKPYVKPSDLIMRVLVPWNKDYKNSLQFLKFLEDQFPLLGYPNASHLPFYSLYCNLHRRVYKGVRICIGQIYETHRLMFEKYSGKIYTKTISEPKVEIYTFLGSRKSFKLSENSKILLGYFGDSYSHTIKF